LNGYLRIERAERGVDAMQAIVSRFRAILVSGVFVLSLHSSLFAAAASQSLIGAKRDAEANGYIFVATHDEIVNRAKQEGQLRVVVSMSEGIRNV